MQSDDKGMIWAMTIAVAAVALLFAGIIYESVHSVTAEQKDKIVNVINSEYIKTDSYPRNKTELKVLMDENDVKIPDKVTFDYSMKVKKTEDKSGEKEKEQSYSLIVENKKKSSDTSSSTGSN